MDLQEFTEITLAVAEEHGVAAYAPTLIAGEAVRVIQGIPSEVDHRDAIQQVIEEQGLSNADYFFGVRSGAQEITTGHHTADGITFMRISSMQQGFMVSPLEYCPWWGQQDPGGH